MINLTSELELARLHRAIKTSRTALAPFNTVRTEFVKDHAGSWYSKGGARFRTYVNKMNQTANIMTFAMVASNPRFKMKATNPELSDFAFHFQENLNALVENINLEHTLYMAVLDAFFMMGMVKVRMADSEEKQLETDIWVDPGRPWVDRVSPDDMILDMSARELTKMRFVGDRYRCSWAKVKERSGGDFDAKVVKMLSPNSKYTYDAQSELASEIAAGREVDDDELEPMIWLQDLWIPENKEWATFAAGPDSPTMKPLKVDKPAGSPQGPYKFLSLGFVPDNIIPSSPAQNLKGLHEVYNRLMKKMIQQAMDSKQVNAFKVGEEKTADIARQIANGGWVPFKDPRDINTITIGSVDGNINAFAVAIDEIYNVQSGNIRAMAGLGSEAGTATQEQMIQEQTSKVISKMVLNVLRFTAEIGDELKCLMWQDEALSQETWIQAGSRQVPSHWTPGYRKGKPEHYQTHVEPYSLMYRPPQAKVSQIFQVLNQISPLWPMFAQSGATLNIKRLLQEIADGLDLPELTGIISISNSQQPGQGVLGGDENTIRSPAVTSREVVRRNVPTGGTAGNRAAMIAQAMQGNRSANQQQMASLGRN